MIKNKWHIFLFIVLIFMTGIKPAIGQVCQGNLGENIFSIGDFGSGEEVFLTQDPGIAPGYAYTTNPPPSDGFYTITNDMGRWANLYGTWLPLQDRSDDPQGYMMVVNASFSPGIFYQETVNDLCENTLYEFSADVINVVRPGVADHSLPNISFLLDGDVFYNTGGVPQDGQWKKYGFTFVTGPDQTSVELTLRNNAPGGIGNDLALDNISFRPCGPDAFANAEKEFLVCSNENNPVEIAAVTDENSSVQWQFLDTMSGSWVNLDGENGTSIFHDNYNPGIYQYRYLSAGTPGNLENFKCRVISDTATVTVVPIDFTVFDTICQNVPYYFGSQEIFEEGFYEEVFIASNGCDSFVDLFLTVVPVIEITYDLNAIDPSCTGFNNARIELNNIRGGYPPYAFKLGSLEKPDPLFINLTAGQYNGAITDRFQCFSEFEVDLQDPELFYIDLGEDTLINLGETVRLELQSNYPVRSAEWLGSYIECSNCLDNSVRPLEDTRIIVNATSENGCDASDSIMIRLRELDEQIYKPNAFSPNEDGINDLFYLQSNTLAVANIEAFIIFDRWGNVVFRGSGPTFSDSNLQWDGRIGGVPAKQGVYSYLMKITLINDEQILLSGDVTLIR